MTLITLYDLSKEYDGKELFKPINLSIYSDQRIAIIGKNGCGKSTLIKMIIKEVLPDKGSVTIAPNINIGYLSQSVINDLSSTLFEEVESTFIEIKKLQERIIILCDQIANDPSNPTILKEYDRLNERLIKLDGYNYKYKVYSILYKFGFKEEDFSRKVSSFSGGERMKVAFCKLLLINPDILILDEPTNHLDISTIRWLENHLKNYKGTILFVSHDKYFINSIANKVLEIEDSTVTLYTGNYDKYAQEKQIRYENLIKLYLKQEKERKRLEWFIKFYMPKPRFVSRAHDREKKLERLNATAIKKPRAERNDVHMRFSGDLREGKRVFECKDLEIGYNNSLVGKISFTFFGGDRYAIMGDNGSGKTTFIKTILNEIRPLSGKINFYDNFRIGYLKQDGIMLESDEDIYSHFSKSFPDLTKQEILNLLGSYSFDQDDFYRSISTLSGGEKMRLVLAKLTAQNYQLLILDEPTNHLDMYAKEELSSALNKFKGSLIIISHDRSFIDSLANHIIYFFNNKSYIFEGNYSEFEFSELDNIISEYNQKVEEKKKILSNSNVAINKEKNIKKKPALSYERLINKIEQVENELNEHRSNLNKEEFYLNNDKLNDTNDKIIELESVLDSLLNDLSYYDDK